MPSRPVDAPSRIACGSQHELVLAEDAETHDVDERVAGVALLESDLPTHRRHTDGVAIAGDPGDDAVQEVPVLGLVERAESDLIPQSDRSGAHREDVTEDPTDACGCSLVRLDERGVVVALDAQCREPSVAEVDDAGVLAGSDDHPRCLGGKTTEMGPRGLVGAMLGPHHRVHGELGGSRVAAGARC